jgi:hypothetical protein
VRLGLRVFLTRNLVYPSPLWSAPCDPACAGMRVLGTQRLHPKGCQCSSNCRRGDWSAEHPRRQTESSSWPAAAGTSAQVVAKSALSSHLHAWSSSINVLQPVAPSPALSSQHPSNGSSSRATAAAGTGRHKIREDRHSQARFEKTDTVRQHRQQHPLKKEKKRKEGKKRNCLSENGELAVCIGTWARGVPDGFEKGMSVFCVLPFVSRFSTACRR